MLKINNYGIISAFQQKQTGKGSGLGVQACSSLMYHTEPQ
ncbi:uncharacterized protein METZ01_LOCUS1225 [marine metagenome]|uniref:Uncharacterized protein n=1 Tax=marine metagenome TaxID=408172 RepID=A0A381N1C0_9ZZZZ